MGARWACLMYHATPADLSQADYFAVPRDALQAQLRAITTAGMRGVSLEQCLASPGDAQQVAMTFDDAHVSNHDVALPLFAEAGMTATVFVVPDFVGTTGYCSWAQLRALAQAGWSIQSHTFTHPFLSTLSAQALRHELRDSRMAIEEAIGAPVVTLALPNGDWPARAHRGLLQEAGYRYIATSRWHANGDTECHRGVFGRYTVRRNTRIEDFTTLLQTRPGFWSREGLRLSALSVARSTLGVHRYRDWRRRLIDRRPAAAVRDDD